MKPGLGPMLRSALYTSLLLIALLLSGCAAAPPTLLSYAWTPDESWWSDAILYGGRFRARDGSIKIVNALHAANLHEVSRKIREQSAFPVNVALLDDDSLNAFATDTNGERQIILTLNFLAAIGHDRDALATSIGHEVAHLQYAHGAARKERNPPGFIDSASFAGVNAVNTSFSRYEEREADIKGMEWAVAAGFSPCGSARTIRILIAHGGGAEGDSFLATHPGREERIARANDMSRKLTGRGCRTPRGH